MDRASSLIDHLKSNQPATWSLLKLAATQGLASINASEDTVMLGEELPVRHERLHYLMFRLMTEWDPERQRFMASQASFVPASGMAADY